MSDNEEGYSDYELNTDDINPLTEEERSKLFFDENEDEDNEKWVTNNYKSSGKKSDGYLSCPCCFTLLCVECQRHSTYKNQYRAISVNNCIVDKDQNIVYNDKRDKNIKKSSSNSNNNHNSNNNNRKKQRRKQYTQKRQKKNQGIRRKLENTHLDDKEEKEDTDTYENTDDTDSEEEEEGLEVSIDDGSDISDDSEDEDEIYQPVKCIVCDTHVAMFDKDEVYHFFNVFPS